MAAPFRVALSGDFRKSDGSPTFPDFDLKPPGTETRVAAPKEVAPAAAAEPASVPKPPTQPRRVKRKKGKARR